MSTLTGLAQDVADAQDDQAAHRRDHGDVPRRLVLVTCPGCSRPVEVDVRSGTPKDPHVLTPHDACPDSWTGVVDDRASLNPPIVDTESA